jgi:hypothetical protein
MWSSVLLPHPLGLTTVTNSVGHDEALEVEDGEPAKDELASEGQPTDPAAHDDRAEHRAAIGVGRQGPVKREYLRHRDDVGRKEATPWPGSS